MFKSSEAGEIYKGITLNELCGVTKYGIQCTLEKGHESNHRGYRIKMESWPIEICTSFFGEVSYDSTMYQCQLEEDHAEMHSYTDATREMKWLDENKK